MEIVYGLEVFICDDYTEGCPSRVNVILDEGEIKNILNLMDTVKKLGVYKIVDWYYWAENESEDFITEAETINITVDDVHFEAMIKHTTIEVYTASIPKKELQENLKVLKMRRTNLPLHLHDLKYGTSKKILAKRMISLDEDRKLLNRRALWK